MNIPSTQSQFEQGSAFQHPLSSRTQPYFRTNLMEHHSSGQYLSGLENPPAQQPNQSTLQSLQCRQNFQHALSGDQHLVVKSPFENTSPQQPNESTLVPFERKYASLHTPNMPQPYFPKSLFDYQHSESQSSSYVSAQQHSQSTLPGSFPPESSLHTPYLPQQDLPQNLFKYPHSEAPLLSSNYVSTQKISEDQHLALQPIAQQYNQPTVQASFQREYATLHTRFSPQQDLPQRLMEYPHSEAQLLLDSSYVSAQQPHHSALQVPAQIVTNKDTQSVPQQHFPPTPLNTAEQRNESTLQEPYDCKRSSQHTPSMTQQHFASEQQQQQQPNQPSPHHRPSLQQPQFQTAQPSSKYMYGSTQQRNLLSVQQNLPIPSSEERSPFLNSYCEQNFSQYRHSVTQTIPDIVSAFGKQPHSLPELSERLSTEPNHYFLQNQRVEMDSWSEQTTSDELSTSTSIESLLSKIFNPVNEHLAPRPGDPETEIGVSYGPSQTSTADASSWGENYFV